MLFRSAMFDEQTLTVAYQAWRGEPRGAHKAGQPWQGRGDCIDCRQCVSACPTGIDIRDGQQLECIGCGLCIDACNEIMDKVDRPRSLIAFSTLSQQAAGAEAAQPALRLIRPRTLLYAVLLGMIGAIMAGAFFMRSDMELSVIRDRAPLYVTLSDGSIRNGYTLRIVNKARTRRELSLSVSGVLDAAVTVAAADGSANGDRLNVLPDSEIGRAHV